MRKLVCIFAVLCAAVAPICAQNVERNVIFQTNMYSQTHVLYEYRNESGAYLRLEMRDNGNLEIKNRSEPYNKGIETIIDITTGWFTDQDAYNKARQDAIDFLDKTLVLVYFKDLPDICQLAPCCSLRGYRIRKYPGTDKEYINIAYECSDIGLLGAISGDYNAYGRVFALKKYVK